MPALLLASSTTVDPLDALLPRTTGSSPIDDMGRALHGWLGVTLVVAAAVLTGWALLRAYQQRRRTAWAQNRMIASVASRGFALYGLASGTPGTDVRSLTPSWPSGPALAHQPCTLPAPRADDVQPPPWATWVRASGRVTVSR